MPILKVAVTVKVQGISQAAGVVQRLRRPRAPAKQRKLKQFQAKNLRFAEIQAHKDSGNNFEDGDGVVGFASDANQRCVRYSLLFARVRQ